MKSFLFRSAVLAAIAIFATGTALRAEHDTSSAEQAKFEEAIHGYLLDHPNVVVEVLQLLRARDKQAEAAKGRANLAKYRNTLLNDPTSPVGGNPDGDVTVIEFFDYHCGYCKRVLPTVRALLDGDPGIRIVYKEYPILGPASVLAARAALASLRQDAGKYRVFHETMMASKARLNERRILDIAEEAGLDPDRLKADMKDPEIEGIIQRNLALADSLGINGTPTFIIGDTIIPGAVDLDTLRSLIAEARSS